MSQGESKHPRGGQAAQRSGGDAHDFVREQGLGFLGHILDRLQDHLAQGFTPWYREMGVHAPTRTHSLMRALAAGGPLAVTDLAARVKRSHPLVISWLRELEALGFVDTAFDPQDRRRRIVSLTRRGKADLKRQKQLEPVFVKAIEDLLVESDADILDALWRIEAHLVRVSFLERLQKAGAG